MAWNADHLLILAESVVVDECGDEDVDHGVEHHLDVLRVRGASEMRVDMSRPLLSLLLQKLLFDVLCGLVVVVPSLSSKMSSNLTIVLMLIMISA